MGVRSSPFGVLHLFLGETTRGFLLAQQAKRNLADVEWRRQLVSLAIIRVLSNTINIVDIQSKSLFLIMTATLSLPEEKAGNSASSIS